MRTITLVLTLLLTPLTAVAGPGDWGTIRLVSGGQADDGAYRAALVIELAPGWKTYWRVPGDAGIPPVLDTAGSSNLRAMDVVFPVPEAEWDADLLSIGYHGLVVLPLVLHPSDPGRAVELDLSYFIGVCEVVCIPAEGNLSLELAPGETAADQGLIAAALALGPVALHGGATCALQARGEDIFLTATFTAPGPLNLVVIESPDPMHLISPVRLSGAGPDWQIEAPFRFFGEGPVTLDRSSLRFSLLGGPNVAEIEGCSG